MSAPASDIARLYLRFALIDGVGPVRFQNLLAHCGGIEGILDAPAVRLAGASKVGSEIADRIVRERDATAAERELEACAEFGVRVICEADAEYPPGLRQIGDRPIVLYVRGELRDTDAIAVAVVGSRRCSIYGSEQARRFGELLAGAGFTVISGLARGIDAFAQHGAVDAGGRSLAVLGSGLDDIYPPENRALAEKILGSGAWISELPIRAAVRAGNFPVRNRIIAGMALGTLVIEAAARSGALSTARYSSEYNRELFALPGRVQDPTSIGTNALIRDGGAKLVTCLEDVLDGLGDVGRFFAGVLARAVQGRATARPASPGSGPRVNGAPLTATLFDAPAAVGGGAEAGASAAASGAPALSAIEQVVYDAISGEPLQDQVIAASGLSTGEVLAALTGLELKGRIRRLPGQRVQRR